jgi:hypothetical protein
MFFTGIATINPKKAKRQMKSLEYLNPEQTRTILDQPVRAVCIIEFIEGNTSRPPVVYPLGGSDEIDEAIRDAILERWRRE